MTLGQLKKLTEGYPDDTIILARDRDCITLNMVDIVGPVPKGIPIEQKDKIKRVLGNNDPIISYHESINTIYGGNDRDDLENEKHIIIFCDND